MWVGEGAVKENLCNYKIKKHELKCISDFGNRRVLWVSTSHDLYAYNTRCSTYSRHAVCATFMSYFHQSRRRWEGIHLNTIFLHI